VRTQTWHIFATLTAAAAGTALTACTTVDGPAPTATASVWGTVTTGRHTERLSMYTLRNSAGVTLRATDLGATIVELHAPDRDGELADITLGFDNAEQYRTESPYFGAIAGRCANRIAQGRFTLDGREHQLATNNGPNHLHGGEVGFDKRVWDAELVDDPRGQSVRFSRTSPAGEEGYPGTLEASVTSTLTDDNELICEMEATTDAPTLCNLAQHAYWNLAGHGSGTIEGHELTIHAERYTPVDATLIPTGELAPVAGTPFDFRQPKPIGRDLMEVGDDPKGYDHNFVIEGDPGAMRPVAWLHEPGSGRVMLLSADQPGLQFYAGNFLDGSVVGKDGVRYQQYGGLCLETQRFPDAINNPGWVSPVLRPGETYRHRMVFRFTTDRDE